MRLAHVNDAFCTLVGRRAEQLLGTGWIDTIHEDDLDGVIEQVAAALDGDEVETQARLVRDDGAVRTTVIRFAHLFTPGVGAGFVGTIEDITDRLAFEAKLAHQANHDPLTGLPNRTLLAAVRRRAVPARRRRPGLPLPRPGQLQGRQRLPRPHRRRRAARRGGRPGCAPTVRPGRPGRPLRRRRVRRRLRERRRGRRRRAGRARVGGPRRARCTSAAWTSAPTPASASPCRRRSTHAAEELIRDCDIAMYQAKAGGKGRITVLDQQARAEARDKLRLVAELRDAIERREITHDVPADLRHRRPAARRRRVAGPVGARRARRDQPRRPSCPLAEESGLISALGLLVLDETCRQMAEWDRLLGDAAPPRANVNVSALQLDDNLAEQVAAALDRHRPDPDRISVEITESALMKDPESARTVLQQLRDLGVELAIDDFGTGYSSLAYLRHLPVDCLKVDRSFVAELADGHAEIASRRHRAGPQPQPLHRRRGRRDPRPGRGAHPARRHLSCRASASPSP